MSQERERRLSGYAFKSPALAGLSLIGAPRFELGTSCPPDRHANQAAPRPVVAQSYPLGAVAPVQLVDQVGHAFEPIGDHTQTVLAEVLGLNAQRSRKRLDHVVG